MMAQTFIKNGLILCVTGAPDRPFCVGSIGQLVEILVIIGRAAMEFLK
jgi:hypothetical protein